VVRRLWGDVFIELDLFILSQTGQTGVPLHAPSSSNHSINQRSPCHACFNCHEPAANVVHFRSGGCRVVDASAISAQRQIERVLHEKTVGFAQRRAFSTSA
jgi:ferredoxin